MIHKNCTLLIIFAVLFIQCSSDMSLNVDGTQGRLQVLSVISPAFERTEVYVGMAYPESAPEEISGARVVLSDFLNKTKLSEVQAGLYQDVSNSITIHPEEKYYLNVEFSNGQIYSDSTIVPGVPEITNYHSGDTLHIIYSPFGDTIPVIKFKQDDLTHGYFLSTIISVKDDANYSAVKTDSFETELSFPTSGIYWFSDTLFYKQARLQVWALDSAATYIDNQYVWGPELQMGWNVFGSMSMSEIDVTVEVKVEAF